MSFRAAVAITVLALGAGANAAIENPQSVRDLLDRVGGAGTADRVVTIVDDTYACVVVVFLAVAQGVCHTQHVPVSAVLVPGGVPFPVHGGGDVARVVIAVVFAGSVGAADLRDPAPLVQPVLCPVALAVCYACDVAEWVIFILLGGTRSGGSAGASPSQVVGKAYAVAAGVGGGQQISPAS